MTSNAWNTTEARDVLELVRKGAVHGARMKKLCRATCQDLAQDVIHQMVRRPYIIPRDPYRYGRGAGYFKACSFLRRKYTEEKYVEKQQQLGNSIVSCDLLSEMVKQEQLQCVDTFLGSLSVEDMILVYGTTVLEESIASIAALLNKATGASLTPEAFRARLTKLKKRAIQYLDVAM